MKLLSMFLIFGGYTLIYAATAKSGRFATEPWAGLFADAYTDPDLSSADISALDNTGAAIGNLPQ